MRYTFLLLIIFQISAHTQPLRDINYRYLYNPSEALQFNLKPVVTNTSLACYYELYLRDSTLNENDFKIQWEARNSLTEKEGKLIQTDSIFTTSDIRKFSGKVTMGTSANGQVLVAKVINKRLKRVWIFYKSIASNYPVNAFLLQADDVVATPYIKNNTSVTIASDTLYKILSYYNDNFPAATPAFSESMGRVSKGMDVDSTFKVTTNQPLTFNKKGLYLVQNDTNAAKGFAFRVEDDYPRFAKLESLADPLIYICTKQEFERIKSAKGEKKAFDRVILSITGDANRAKTFMRSYFRRVELANHYFTSYKEGWKTDRGMIYIIFGVPDEVFKFSDREIWSYKSSNYKIEFDFTKSSTVFDPENFVLIRQKRFQETWYQVIDLWRNARF